MLDIAVTTTTDDKAPDARILAAQLKVDFIESPTSPSAVNYRYLLIYTPEYLGLQKTQDKLAPFYIDFLSGRLLTRYQQAGLRKELLARAMGCHPKEQPLIVDATAGLGRDSFVLATLGFHILMLERSAILFYLLQDALTRAQQNEKFAAVVKRLQLLHVDALTWLQETEIQPDIIYLDPMFPTRKKSASVKKEMALLQNLLGTDQDAQSLLEMALTCAKKRVVLKRPRISPTFNEKHNHYSLIGKNSRFDVYLV